MHSNKDPVFLASIGAKELGFMLNLKVFLLSIFLIKHYPTSKENYKQLVKPLKNGSLW